MKNIMILSASSNNNLELAQKFKEMIESKETRGEVVNLVDLNFPLYSTVKEKEIGLPEGFQELFKRLESAHGFVFLAPEYNGGIPPVLTNFIAWSSRAHENWRSCFNGKHGVIGTHSGSGGANVLAAMRVQLSYIGLNVLGRQIHTHYKKELSKDSLDAVVTELCRYI